MVNKREFSLVPIDSQEQKVFHRDDGQRKFSVDFPSVSSRIFGQQEDDQDDTIPRERYTIFPKPENRDALPFGQRPLRWEYQQHRLMNEGRAIALGISSIRRLNSSTGDTWLFDDFKGQNSYSLRTVTWDGLGDPLEAMGVDYGSGNPGGINAIADTALSDTEFGEYAPDSFVWAVYFLVNGVVPRSLWFPTPSRYPEWNDLGIGAVVPEYP